MTFKHLMIAGVSALMLTACGNKAEETAEIKAEEGLDAAYDAMEKQADKARDVKIKDKKGLTKSQRMVNTYLNGMEDMVSALEKVDDRKSAEEAAKVISKISAEFNELSDAEDMSRMGMTQALMSRQREFVAIQQRIASEMMRISQKDPELMQMLSEEMRKLEMK